MLLKIKLIIILLMFVVAGCAGTQVNTVPIPDIQVFIEKLKSTNTASIETKRAAAIAILEHVVFDIGFWEVMLETSDFRPEPKVSMAMSEIIRLALKRDGLPEGEELSDYELSRTLGWSLVMTIGITKHLSKDIAPQIAQLLTLL